MIGIENNELDGEVFLLSFLIDLVLELRLMLDLEIYVKVVVGVDCFGVDLRSFDLFFWFIGVVFIWLKVDLNVVMYGRGF